MDERRVAERLAAVMSAPEVRQARGVLWALLVACRAVGLWLLWRRFALGRRHTGSPAYPGRGERAGDLCPWNPRSTTIEAQRRLGSTLAGRASEGPRWRVGPVWQNRARPF